MYTDIADKSNFKKPVACQPKTGVLGLKSIAIRSYQVLWQADKIVLNSEILYWTKYSNFHKGTVLL